MKKFKPSYGAGFIIRILYHLTIVFRNFNGLDRIKVYFYSAKINLKNQFSKIFEFNHEKIFGFNINFPEYSYFRSLFYEIFVAKSYYFFTEKKDPVIIDCGGNIGMSVLFFKYVYPNSKIIVFEPWKETFEYLKKNVEKFDDVIIKNAALSNANGKINLYSPKKVGSGDTTIFQNESEKFSKVNTQEVESLKLSKFIDGFIDLLKLDIEGAEGIVVKDLDSEKKLNKIKNIVMEYHYNRSSENDLVDILNILRKNKFEVEFQSIKYPPLEFYQGKNYTMLLFAKNKSLN